MVLQATTNINIDFYNKKYTLINAKQYDKKSRFLSLTCYHNGEILPINNSEHSAYIRYNKPDDKGVFNACDITREGKILVELTEQMLVLDGICYADLVIIEKGSANVDINTGQITGINNSSILSSMILCIDVTETPFENSTIESTYEYDGLNDLLERAEAEYSNVIKLAKSYAHGNAGGIRPDEDTDNAKYYYEQSLVNANNAQTSEQNAKVSEDNAKISEQNAKVSETNAKDSETKSKASETNALASEQKAKASETNAKTSETNAKTSETNAHDYSIESKRYAVGGTGTVVGEDTDNSKYYYQQSLENKNNSDASAADALNNANISKSYAVGQTGTRPGEDTDNAKYYYGMTKTVVNGLNSGFVPIGSILFSELATAEKATGYSYNIKDDFVTDSTFREGAGKSYTAGTNVYYTHDGYWDCFGGSASVVATVEEVKQYLMI